MKIMSGGMAPAWPSQIHGKLTSLHFGAKKELTPASLKSILADIRYKEGYYFVAHGNNPNNLAIQVTYMAPDNFEPGSKAKIRTGTIHHPISANSTPGQVVQRALVALMAVDEHEIRENFKYKGLRIFHPHFKLDDLSRFLERRAEKPTPPDWVHTTKADVQHLLNDCTTMDYKLKVERAVQAPDNKFILVVKIVKPPNVTVNPCAVANGMINKRITFVTGKSTTKILRNLMEALIDEQRREIKFDLRYKDFAMFSNEVPISHVVEYARNRNIR